MVVGLGLSCPSVADDGVGAARQSAAPIRLTWGGALNDQAIMKSAVLPGVEAGLCTEACIYKDARIHCEHLNIQKIEERKRENGQEFTISGNVGGADGMPFRLTMRLTPEVYRVKVTTEIHHLPEGITPLALVTCLQSSGFTGQNSPPFDMARQAFAIIGGKGVSWISDVQRNRAEQQQAEGPWIQSFGTQLYPREGNRPDATYQWNSGPPFPGITNTFTPDLWRNTEEIAVSPLVGWVAKDNSYMVAIASHNAYKVATRWGPCLHSEPAFQDAEGNDVPFETTVYLLPADLKLLVELAREDFALPEWSIITGDQETLWPYQAGELLDGLESEELSAWRTVSGSFRPYKSGGDWVAGSSAGALMTTVHPEGVTEGNRSAVWEVPADSAEATLVRRFKSDNSLTHVGIDAINRGTGKVEISVNIEQDDKVLGAKTFVLNQMTNRRLLVPVTSSSSTSELRLRLHVGNRSRPAKIVLDNLRGFTVNRSNN